MTTQEYKRMRRKQQRQELKEIEAALHPCPVINGVEICHEHRGGNIVFSAWKGNDPAQELGSRKHIEYDRINVLMGGADFYRQEHSNMEWLTKQGRDTP